MKASGSHFTFGSQEEVAEETYVLSFLLENVDLFSLFYIE